MSLSLLPSRQCGLLRSRASRPAQIVRAPVCIRAQASPALVTTTTTSTNGTNGASVPQPVVVNFPAQVPGVTPPADTYQNVIKAGVKKTQMTAPVLFVSGILAGAFIAYGAFLTCTVQGGMLSILAQTPGIVKLIGGLIFPVGLTLVTLSGAELYTGNTAVIPIAAYEKQATLGGMFHNWFWSYLGNFVGSLMMVAAVYATGILQGNPIPVNMAEMKSNLPWAVALIRSILCNWLVCMAVWNATSATTLPGKMMGLWGPIATFVAIGLEHSVANMFFIPMGIALGAKVTFSQFLWNNLLPVTLGNTIGGFVFVGTAFAFIHGSLGKKKEAAPVPVPSAN